MLRTYLKYKSPAIQFLVFMGIILASFFVGSFLSLLPQQFYSISTTDILSGALYKSPYAKPYLISVQTIQVFFLFIIPSIVFAYFADPKPQQFLGTQYSGNKSFYPYTFLLVILGLLCMGFLGLINSKVPLPKWAIEYEKLANQGVEVLVSGKSISDLIVNIIVIGLFAAISEELCFRAVLQRIFIQWSKNPWVGIIITSILFSAFHFQFAGFLPRFALGIILGALYWYSGSLWTSILFHFLFNSLQTILAFYKPSTLKNDQIVDTSPLSIIIVGTLATIGIVRVILKLRSNSKTNYAEVYPEKPALFDQQF